MSLMLASGGHVDLSMGAIGRLGLEAGKSGGFGGRGEADGGGVSRAGGGQVLMALVAHKEWVLPPGH